MTKPSSLKISPARRAQLRDVYLLAFDNFATDSKEVANLILDGSTAKATAALNTLRDVNLLVTQDVNDAAQGTRRRGAFKRIAWQASETHDDITREDAIAKFDATFPTNTNTNRSHTMTSTTSTTTTRTVNKTEQRELDRHSALREAFSEAFADVETNEDGTKAVELAEKRDAIALQLTGAANKLRKRGYTLRNDDSKPTPPTQETTNVSATATAAEPKLAPTLERLFEYLRDSVTTEFDPERELRPYVNSNGKLFIHSSDWIDWLTNHGTPFAKTEAAQPLRELGLVVRATPIPTKDYAKGFYQGALPKQVKDLPRRESRRAAAGTPRATRNPFAKLPAEQLSYLRNLVTKDTRKVKDDVEAARTAVLTQLDAAAGENA